MSQPDYKSALDAAMEACDCLTPRCLIERIVETYNLPKRAIVTDEMRNIIREKTLAGDTAWEIAIQLAVSEPTVIAQRRKLGLVTPRAKPVAPAETASPHGGQAIT
jgi:hypothetical protein